MGDISNRVKDAFQAAQSIEILKEEIINLNKMNEKAEKILEDLGTRKDPDEGVLRSLDMGSSKGYTLRIKLRALISLNKNRLQELRSKMRTEVEILRNVSICPYCKGSGENLSHGYERFGRRIHTTISSDKCEHCDGFGKIELGKEVEKIVENTLRQVSDARAGGFNN